MADRDSEVPLDLQRSFESTDGEISFTKPLELFPPDEWPPCPDCGDRLTISAVATDAQGELVYGLALIFGVLTSQVVVLLKSACEI